MSTFVAVVFSAVVLCILVSGVESGVVHEGVRHSPREAKWNTLSGERPIFFAHRGETVLLPGHTSPAYEVAAIEQAEYVEPDLVITKDGYLVCYHDVTLKHGTDVEDHPEFDDLKTSYSGIIGDVHEEIVDDYFVQDFTLNELRTLHVKQRRNGIRPRYFDTFQIPTFHEYLDIVHKMTITLNKTIGIIPELKHTRFHNNRTSTPWLMVMEDKFLSDLEAYGYPVRSAQENCTGQFDMDDSTAKRAIKCPPVIIQSFEKVTIDYLSTQTSLDLMMLVDPVVSLLTKKGMEEVAKVAKWMCPWKEYIYAGVEKQLEFMLKEWNKTEIEELGGFVPSDKFVEEAHRLGLKMSIFTINDSREPSNWGCAVVPGCNPDDKRAELFYYFNMGMDGIFVENVSESREIRMIYEYEELQELETTTTTTTTSTPTTTTRDGAINIAPVSLLSIVVAQVSAFLLRQTAI